VLDLRAQSSSTPDKRVTGHLDFGRFDLSRFGDSSGLGQLSSHHEGLPSDVTNISCDGHNSELVDVMRLKPDEFCRIPLMSRDSEAVAR
jgi:hypothetical protein